MRKATALIIIFCCLLRPHIVKAQTGLDTKHITDAQTALDAANNCESAINQLRLVSDSGKTTYIYLLTLARANDCRANRELALLYYKKYSAVQPGNDSVQQRIAELTAEKPYKQTVSEQEKKANAIYKSVKHGDYHNAISERDFAWGISFDVLTGGKETPYKQAFTLYNIQMLPFAHNHVQFELHSRIGYMTGGQKDWFAQVLNTTPDNITKVPGTVHASIDVAFNAVVLNKQKLAITVGPMSGLAFYLMPDASVNNASNDYTHPIMFSPTFGLRSSVYIRRHLVLGASYTVFTRYSYSNETQTGTTITPLNGNYLSLSVGIRGFGEPAYIYK